MGAFAKLIFKEEDRYEKLTELQIVREIASEKGVDVAMRDASLPQGCVEEVKDTAALDISTAISQPNLTV